MIKKKRVLIFGSGGHARVAADIFDSLKIDVIGFFDDNPTTFHTRVLDWRVLGNMQDLCKKLENRETDYFVAIGDNAIRQKVSTSIQSIVKRPPVNCIAPGAILSKRVSISNGVLVAPGAVVNVGVSIGPGVIVNTASSVDHDCILSEYCSIQPGARLGGGVFVGKRTMIGIGASVRQYIEIGNDAVVGGGAMVIHAVPNQTTVFGVPAKSKKDI